MSTSTETRQRDQAKLERALEALDDDEGEEELTFDPEKGELVSMRRGEVEGTDRIPATQMAREGFFWRVPARSCPQMAVS